MQGSSRIKSKSKKPFVIVAIICFVALGLNLMIDRNPKTFYHPTDGMKMAVEHARQLFNEEGIKGPFFGENGQTKTSLGQWAGLNIKPKYPTVGIFIVHYRGSAYPSYARAMIRLAGLEIPDPMVEYRSCVFNREMMALEEKTAMISGNGLPPTTSQDAKELEKFNKSLQNLEPNGMIRLRSDFAVVQVNEQIRTYPLDHLPPNVQALYEFEERKLHGHH